MRCTPGPAAVRLKAPEAAPSVGTHRARRRLEAGRRAARVVAPWEVSAAPAARRAVPGKVAPDAAAPPVKAQPGRARSARRARGGLHRVGVQLLGHGPAVDAAVNAVMVALTGCAVSSDCPLSGFPGTTVDEMCQSFFAAVTAELRAQGFCAGQHAVGSTDEIAVSNTGCAGKWFGYHICNYGGPKVVWNQGARRGWWAIDPAYCP